MAGNDHKRKVGIRSGSASPGKPEPVVLAGPGAGVPGGTDSGPKVVPPHPSTKKALAKVMGERCAEARRRLSYSQRGFAKDMGMSASWVRECENGAQFSPAWLVVTLSEAAKLPVGWFFGYGDTGEQ